MTDVMSARKVGRPRDPAKADAIVAAAWSLFLARGVEAVTVDAIAHDAGVSKGTVYSYFRDKFALFEEGVRREMQRIELAQKPAAQRYADLDLEAVLLAFGTGIMTFLASPSAVDFYNSLAGELRRNAGLARTFYDAGPGRTLSNLAKILASPLAAHLRIDDPIAAAETLFGMWQGFSNYRLSLGVDDGVARTIDERVRDGIRRFLKAYAM